MTKCFSRKGGVPIHEAESEVPLNLGINQQTPPPMLESRPLKADGTPDLRYKTGSGGV